ncbi:hypothetical protein [Actinoplanes siamensis]|uniref:Circularly permuted type 2 ATP-grasp protein n=1 Tax=Actinoplanes siamensis TaxID=1223317 RepID=A0A919N323_9ACTN|nr:hypothetical protein [Actinoplanes siamensis]GIF03133.1 hypothetical protein Asi03nite_06710 [Actinoplanes siamensis]
MTITGLPPTRVAEILAGHLADIPMGRFPTAAEPMVLPSKAYRALLAATRRLTELSCEVVRRLAPDQAGRMAALRVDPSEYRRTSPDEEFELRHAGDVVRADVVIGADGPRFIELNVGAGIGGVVQFEQQRRAWRSVRLEAGLPPLDGEDLFGLLAKLIKRYCAELSLPVGALLIGTMHDPGMGGAVNDTQIRLLGEHGVPARFAELPGLLDEIRPGDRLGIIQFCEDEAAQLGWDVTPMLTAIKDGLRTAPSESTRLVDSKKVLAWMSEGLPWMSREDRDLVQRFVPWSRVLGDRLVSWRGDAYELPRLLVEQREHFVLKGAAGLSSREVFFGASTEPEEWAQLVEAAVGSEYYVAQELVTPVRRPVPVMLDESGRTDIVIANPVISPFCVGGVPTGCLMRFDTATGPGAVTVKSGAMLGCLLGDTTR